MKPIQPSIPSLCVHAFRKAEPGEQITEESLRPDSEVANLINKHKVRVQDLLEELSDAEYSADDLALMPNVLSVIKEYRILKEGRN